MAGEDHWLDRPVTLALEKTVEDVDDEWDDWKVSAIRMEAIVNVSRTLPTPCPDLMKHYAILNRAVLGWRLQQLTARPLPRRPGQHRQWPPELL